MLTDAEARDLLRAAADTIDVDPAEPLPAVHRPHLWPMLVAAAAVVAVVATTLALAERGALPDPSSPSPSPAVNRIPPVMGLDPADADERLEALGLEVRTRIRHGCVEPRVAEGTTPPVGSRFSPGDVVEVTVRDGSMDFCVDTQSRAWELLRFALEVGPAPRFAEEVTLYAGDAEPVTLTADQASDAEQWKVCERDNCASALSALTSAATAPASTEFGPSLTATEDHRSRAEACVPSAASLAGTPALRITIAEPRDGISLCATATAYYSDDGLLEAVAIPLGPASEADPDPRPTAAAVAAAEQFVAWSRGTGPMPDVADKVGLRLSGFTMPSISAEEARDPGRWMPCHRMVSNCPPPIPHVLRERGEIHYSAGLPEGGCWPRSQGPQGWSPDVTLTWRVGLDCEGWLAVQLDLNERGQIAGANLVPAF